MADVLILGQQQINSSALSGPIEISGTFQQQLTPKWDHSTCDSVLKQAKKNDITPELALPIW